MTLELLMSVTRRRSKLFSGLCVAVFRTCVLSSRFFHCLFYSRGATQTILINTVSPKGIEVAN